MKYLSLFSGIEAATVAWKPLGWSCVAVAEIEPLPCSLLKEYYPETPNLGDVTKITEDQIARLGNIDLVVFGSPCQDLSLAGKRRGFDGERSGLFHDAIRIIRWARKHNNCRFALWENVPGSYSSNEGRDFAIVVEQLSGLDNASVPKKGWGNEGLALGDNGLLEWSCLDSQWFGVAQRRKRVFALADFGNWSDRAPILLEPESLRGNSAPSRQERKDVAGTLTSRTSDGGGLGTDLECSGGLQPVKAGFRMVAFGEYADDNTASTMKARDYKDATDLVFQKSPIAAVSGEVAHTLTQRYDSTEDGTGRGTPVIAFAQNQREEVRIMEVAGALAAQPGMKQQTYIGFPERMSSTQAHTKGGISPALQASNPMAVASSFKADIGYMVRRLTPVECERLQGFPDGYTSVIHKKKLSADGPRYKALGNSMTVNVMRWIGQQIEKSLS